MKIARYVRWLSVPTLATIASVAYKAHALPGTCGNCGVSHLYVRPDGWVMIGTGIENDNGPGCSSNDKYLAVDPTTAKGRAALAVATTAMLSGRKITYTGADTCSGSVPNVPGNVEVLSSIYLLP